MTLHTLGYPRLGPRREYKFALEDYWAGKLDENGLEAVGRRLRADSWQAQAEAGLDLVTVGDFAWFDHILTWSATLGALPERHVREPDYQLETLFRAARGIDRDGYQVPALALTKWFDSNYHYLVPELAPDQRFELRWHALFDQVAEARALGHPVKAVIPGPLTWLWLSRTTEPFDRLDLLPRLIPVYREVLNRLQAQGVDWVQIDEPAFALELPQAWLNAIEPTYHDLKRSDLKLLLAVYYGEVQVPLATFNRLPVAGLHVDAVRAPEQARRIAEDLGSNKVLSLGLINGRNVWAADLAAKAAWLHELPAIEPERLWLGTSAPLWHVPLDLALEEDLPDAYRGKLAFARQKLDELAALKHRASHADTATDTPPAATPASALQRRVRALEAADFTRAEPFAQRKPQQQRTLDIPLLPTTTIGSFPQTREIRQWRRDFKQGRLSPRAYDEKLQRQLEETIRRQEALGLDVLVHGEAERNDMVEYFGEQLDGILFTRHGWVQSYGSRGVKPPLIVDDVSRPGPITVDWAQRAQALTDKPVKGMLTGPVTILNWSFVREDIPRADVAFQIALALQAEVQDLEQAGIRLIQIDEPALREGMPLVKKRWPDYLDWAVKAFRLTCARVKPTTQIHTHMCYASFGDILEAVEAMDADVITLECSRSRGALLDMLERFPYRKDMGPGVFDVHSPAVPEADHIKDLLRISLDHIPAERLWVNPDCGLKTRQWAEVEAALKVMVASARAVRAELDEKSLAPA
ncbi:5-methyltetrahydropteroyltriglutamate--homocysteine S-methyltransferase [Marinobacteraceae bacterium S3BR75-40.1]